MWCRCDARSVNLFEFDMYSGKKIDSNGHGLGEGVVLQLTDKINGLGCRVLIDIFFNSAVLQKKAIGY